MINIKVYFGDKLVESTYHGAFKSYRTASEWLVREGYEPFLDDEASEFFETETLGFISVDKDNDEKYIADIQDFILHD